MTATEHSSLASSVESELSKARDSLRQIDDDIRLLTGRNAEELSNRFGKGRNRFSTDTLPREDAAFGRGPRSAVRAEGDRVGAGGIGQKRRITYGERSQGFFDEGDGGDAWKRPRMASEYSRTTRFAADALDSSARSVKPVVQSSVTMPLKEVKSREEAISELKGTERREMAVRNRRMFGVLLGTLKKFKKDEEKQNYKDQEKKQKEIETRLEEAKRAERAQMEKERHKLLDKRRRQEQDLRRLQRKRALVAATDNQIALLKRLQNFIQTNTKPPIFFMPAKHTIRTIELQKKSQKKLEEIIRSKREEMEKEVKEMDDVLVAAADDDEDEREEAAPNESPPRIGSITTEPSQAEAVAKREINVSAERDADDSPTARRGNATNGDEKATPEEERPEERVKSKDIHDELKELTADYAEELNFEDDEQQR